MIIYLCAGHGGSDSGAVYFGKKESDLTFDFTSSLHKVLSSYDINCLLDKKENKAQDTINYLKNIIKQDDIALDFHFNASENKDASGCEVFVPESPSKKEIDLAGKVCYTISTYLGIKNRGIKKPSESKRGKIGFLELNCNTILIEICFMSNLQDMDKYEKNKLILLKKFIDVF